MPYLNKSVKIYYERSGIDGDWVTLINGYSRTHQDLKNMQKSLVAAGYRVIILDNRGCGQSLTINLFQIEDLAQDIIDIWQENNIDSSHLIGFSMGGMISQWISASHPSRIQSLILISTTPDQKWNNSKGISANAINEIEEDFSHYVSPSFFERNRLLIKAMAKDFFQKMQDDHIKNNLLFQRKAIDHFSSLSTISKIDAPTLIIHGTADRIIPIDAAKALHHLIEKSELRFVEGKGHLLLAECPQLLKGYAEKFLNKNKAR